MKIRSCFCGSRGFQVKVDLFGIYLKCLTCGARQPQVLFVKEAQ